MIFKHVTYVQINKSCLTMTKIIIPIKDVTDQVLIVTDGFSGHLTLELVKQSVHFVQRS